MDRLFGGVGNDTINGFTASDDASRRAAVCSNTFMKKMDNFEHSSQAPMTATQDDKPKKKRPWYMGTDEVPYVPKPKGTPWYAIEPVATVLVIIFPFWFFVVQGVGYLNNNPEPSELISINAIVVNTYRLTPHLLVRLPDGSVKSMEFPVAPSMRGGGYAYGGWREDKEAKEIIGCNARIKGAAMRWTFEDRFRVWELSCAEKNLNLGGMDAEKNRLIKNFKRDALVVFLIWLAVPVLILLIVLVRERKSHV